MKIALPTNDRKEITKRTGRAKEFVIYTIDNSVITGIEYKKNEHDHDHEHNEEEEHTHKEIIDLLRGIDLLVVRAIGKHFKRDVEEAKIEYKKTKEEEIDNVIKEYL
jgi:predicted Fe-Mo cluster-binding NifX family protein